ncbi:hypothetical protein [Streptomyces sp. NBC_00996]|uniref:hypothetical protein n=1 Tax=Streptomyces sp. NBC_00996 TaxID=2903710 RepID=UPI0038664751|nr:hypothetical protein OG390_40585 [Streptomyces sp. NBC_00996]
MLVIGALFFISGVIFAFNPMGAGEKLIRLNFRAGGVRLMVSERYLARKLGIMFLVMGSGVLAAQMLLSLGVDEGALISLLPVAVVALLALVGSTIYAIYRASSRHDGG